MIRQTVLSIVLIPGLVWASAEDITTGNRQVEEQFIGEFALAPRRPSVPLGQIQKAFQDAKPSDTVRFLAHVPNQRVELVVRENMASVIEFSSFERIQNANIIVGDRAYWRASVLKDKPYVVTVRGAHGVVGTDTSLVIVGDSGHVYTFRLTSVNDRSTVLPDVYTQVKAKKPLRPMKKEVKKTEAQKPKDESPFHRKVLVDPGQISFKYAMYGDREIAPERVWNDGRFTYFDYGKSIINQGEVRIAYLVDNVETPFTRRLAADKQGRIVVNHVGDFSIRQGKKRVCVFYKGAKR